MTSDIRRALIFIALGVVAACAIGYFVWHLSVPNTNISTRSVITEAAAEASPPSTVRTTSDPNMTTRRRGVEVPGYGSDPFLAPNAVINQSPQRPEPETVYRPGSIFDNHNLADTSTSSPLGDNRTGDSTINPPLAAATSDQVLAAPGQPGGPQNTVTSQGESRVGSSGHRRRPRNEDDSTGTAPAPNPVAATPVKQDPKSDSGTNAPVQNQVPVVPTEPTDITSPDLIPTDTSETVAIPIEPTETTDSTTTASSPTSPEPTPSG
ncbi:MAG: hypothetical protein SOW59_05110 [Corynebacterium sp.]|nr:hypothetical protein [Corynebacterium sp.]